MPATKKKIKHEGFGYIFTKLQEEISNDPVDFELPEEWLNKSKPMDYVFIKRNIYRTKRLKRRLEDDDGNCSCNTTVGSSGVCGKDCICGMLLSSCSSGCKCGSSCTNKPFDQRPVKKMKIVQTEKCGTGVVADEDIKQGEFVIEYVGEVIDDETCEDRLWKMKGLGETNFYLCEVNRDMVIDATYKGNESRYINHSCCPNTEMQKWTIDGETRIGIFATRDIKKGEHLTYDYQFVQFGADQDCHCGATGCREKLGVKANKLKIPSSAAALKVVARHVAATSHKVKAIPPGKDDDCWHIGGSRDDAYKRRNCSDTCIDKVVRIIRGDESIFGIVKRFHSNTKKHTIMFEDGSSEILDMARENWEFFPV